MHTDIRCDVLVQRPMTIEAVRTAADIMDASTRTVGEASRRATTPP